MPQDFSKKMTIAVREDIASWQLTNTVGHIAAYLGNKMQDAFDTGDNFSTKDGVQIPRNSQFPVVTLSGSHAALHTLARTLQEGAPNVKWIVYVQEMIDHSDDTELTTALSEINSGALSILGIGLFGEKEILKKLTSGMKLWK